MQAIELVRQDLPYEVNEEMKLLRTNMKFCGAEKRVIFITSAIMSEGKSTLSLNLCTSIAENGYSVLLIDADMRKSSLKRYVVGNMPELGLSHYLSGQCEIVDVICKTNRKNLFVIAGGAVPPNPSELLSSNEMDAIINAGRKACDYVIIDCPPIGMVVDAAVVAAYCDGCIMLIESGNVKYRLAQKAISKIRATNCPLLGVVLNKVDRRKNKAYYGRYYGKKYAGYYSYEK